MAGQLSATHQKWQALSLQNRRAKGKSQSQSQKMKQMKPQYKNQICFVHKSSNKNKRPNFLQQSNNFEFCLCFALSSAPLVCARVCYGALSPASLLHICADVLCLVHHAGADGHRRDRRQGQEGTCPFVCVVSSWWL